MSNIFFGIAILSVIWGIVSALVMASYISRRGYKISILLFRLLIFKYIRQYYEITAKENGQPGIWFYSYIISMNLALVCAVLGAIVK